jgi:hypothetical protein
MAAIERRTFLQISANTLGASALGEPLAAPPPGPAKPNGESAKIFFVFFGVAPSEDDTDLRPVTNDEIIRRLQAACPGVVFTVRDLTKEARLEKVLNEMKDLKNQGFDGVIVYGWPRDNDLLRTGLPTINIAVVNDFMNIPFPLYPKNRVIGAALDPWRFCANTKITEKMFLDLVDKIKLIRTLKRMRKEHILTVTDSPYVNVTYGDTRKHMPPDYNQRIQAAIGEAFGTRVTRIGTKEVAGDKYIAEVWQGENREAREIAMRWIRNGQKMVNTIESEVVGSAKVYLVMKHLMERYEATAMAFHIRSLVEKPRPIDYVTPCAATSEFQLHHVVAKCQSHLNVILSEMLLQYAYGRPSMLGDFSVDTYNNTSIVQHCEGPWNPWGDDRRVAYVLRDHRERIVRAHSQPGVSLGWCMLYPPNEPVTFWQVDVFSKEVLLHTGRTVPMFSPASKYRDHFYEMM